MDVFGRAAQVIESIGVPKHSELEPDHNLAARDGSAQYRGRLTRKNGLRTRVTEPSGTPMLDWNSPLKAKTGCEEHSEELSFVAEQNSKELKVEITYAVER